MTRPIVALLAFNSVLLLLAVVKAFWLWRIWRLVRKVEPVVDPLLPPRPSEALVTTFEVRRKVTRG